jgi:hypothetical protein
MNKFTLLFQFLLSDGSVSLGFLFCFWVVGHEQSETAAGLGFSDVSMFAGCRLQGTLFLILLNNC